MSNARPERPLTAVSRETEDKIIVYQQLLQKWQKAINLISGQTLKEFRSRHVDDSLQLVDFINKKDGVLFDFGSGAGFPGLVLAMALPGLKVHLFESDTKKCTFLRTVSRETNTPVEVHESRIEGSNPDSLPLPDLITARALAPLSGLCAYALPWAEKNPALRLLFLKGENVDSEIAEAARLYSFSFKKHPSKTGSEGCVLELSGLCISVA